MGRIIAMLATCLIIGGILPVILIKFLKRLKKIETDKWGEHAGKWDK